MKSMERLKVEHLFFTYEASNHPVLKDITFKLLEGEALGVIGLNGCGKTTMSYCLCGIIPHYLKGKLEGRVLVNGKTPGRPLYTS